MSGVGGKPDAGPRVPRPPLVTQLGPPEPFLIPMPMLGRHQVGGGHGMSEIHRDCGSSRLAFPGARATECDEGKMMRVGVLWYASNADQEKVYLDVLTKAFSDLGYVEGKNIESAR